jgi:small GTP-binding protein
MRHHSFASSVATLDATHATDANLSGGGGGEGGSISISILGEGGVGKSCLTQRLLKGKSWTFTSAHDPTIEDAYRKDLYVDNIRSKLELIDTAGQEEFTSFRHQWMKDKDAYVFVFRLEK